MDLERSGWRRTRERHKDESGVGVAGDSAPMVICACECAQMGMKRERRRLQQEMCLDKRCTVKVGQDWIAQLKPGRARGL